MQIKISRCCPFGSLAPQVDGTSCRAHNSWLDHVVGLIEQLDPVIYAIGSPEIMFLSIATSILVNISINLFHLLNHDLIIVWTLDCQLRSLAIKL